MKSLLFALQIVRLMHDNFEQFGQFYGRVCFQSTVKCYRYYVIA